MDRSPRLLSGAARGGDTVCAAYTTERRSAGGIGCEGATLCAGLGSSAPFSLLVELSVACRTFRPCRTSTAALAASVVELPPNGACKERPEGIRVTMHSSEGGGAPRVETSHVHPPPPTPAATKPRRALLVLNLPSFRSMEHTTPSASNRDGDALATTPPLDLGDPTLSQWTKGALPSETTR